MHTNVLHFFTQTRAKIRRYPKKYTIGGSVLALLIVTLAVGLWPRTISFAYSGESCAAQPVLLPGLLKARESNGFTLQTTNEWRVGSVPIAAGNICAVSIGTPKGGEYHSLLSLFGFPVGTRYTIKVASPPKATFTALSKPLPVSKPLVGTLSAEDTIFTYRLAVNDKKAACKTNERRIVCDVPSLGLEQGKPYRATIERQFKSEKVTTIATHEVRTLTAVAVKDTSIKPNATVYDKPTSLLINFDKPVERMSAILRQINGDKPVERKVEAVSAPEGYKVSWEGELDRTAHYEMTIDKVVARDGSSLVEPYKLPFVVSGGPKVASISIPKTGVKPGTVATISFDQPLSEKQDISKFVVLGGGATLAGKQGNRITVSLAAVPKCGDFSIKLGNDIASQYDVSGHSAWSFGGRMLCHTTSVIGQSSKGRPITAYHFGSGPATVIYTGAIHGTEVSTRSLMLRWIDELEANARSIPADKTIIVIPVLNPDGVASGSRTNGNNVDLNRNFGTSDWQSDITTVTNAPFPKGGGPSPMSEPETRAIAGLVGRTGARLVLSYHSIGGLVAANQSGISNSYAQTYSRLSGYRNATGSGSAFEYAISGTADDYYGQVLGVASILIELGSHTYHQFERNQQAMWAMLK